MKKLVFVGTGPGDPDLLTVRAARCIKDAQVIVWTDSLISPEIISLASSSCELIPTSTLTLEEILSIIIKRINAGKKVIRLHDGDPCLYGAISEQICKLVDHQIDIEVIPGISAYQATAASLKAELTIPGTVQTIILSRAEGRTGLPENEKLENLAKINASLCIYLSARHVEEVQATLLKYYSEETPVAIAYRVGWKDQLIKIVSLSNMANFSRQRRLIRTTLYIVSPAFYKSSKRSKLYSSEHDHLFRPKKKQL